MTALNDLSFGIPTGGFLPSEAHRGRLVMAAQFNLRQMGVALPLVAVMLLLVSVGSLSPLVAVSALLAMGSGFWNRIVTRLTENGFV